VNGQDVVVIGAGHNGLVAAALLARSGLRVTVVDGRTEPGGCLVTEELWPGYLVDTGTTRAVGLDPDVVRELEIDGAVDLIRPEIPVAALSGDAGADGSHGGGALLFHRDPEVTARNIARFSARDEARWPAFLEAVENAGRVLRVLYREVPLVPAGIRRTGLRHLIGAGVRLRRVGKKEALETTRMLPMSMEELLAEWFESDIVAGSLAAEGVAGITLGPLGGATALGLLHGAACGRSPAGGQWRVRGGMARLATVLAERATTAGAELVTGSPVAEVLISDGVAAGVRLVAGGEIAARAVLSCAGPRHTLLNLVDPAQLPPDLARSAANIRCRGSLATLAIALDGLPATGDPALDAAFQSGTTVRAAPSINYVERAYDAAKYGGFSQSPVVDATLVTGPDPSLAPPGMHLLSVSAQYFPCGALEPDRARETATQAVLGVLERWMPGLHDRIRHVGVFMPEDFEARFGMTGGDTQHGELALDQWFFMRPAGSCAQYRTPVPGLYLGGAGSHPGPGITGRPGMMAAKAVLADQRTGGSQNHGRRSRKYIQDCILL